MGTAGTAYIELALKPDATQTMAREMAAELRRFADYLDAYPAEEDEG